MRLLYNLIFVLALSCVLCNNVSAQQYDGDVLYDFIITRLDDEQPIMGYGKSATDIGLIIYSNIKDLEIKVTSAVIGNVVNEYRYDDEKKAYILSLKPFKEESPKYTMEVNHPAYRSQKFRFTHDDLDKNCIIFKIDGTETFNEEIKELAKRIKTLEEQNTSKPVEVYGERSRKPEKHDDRRSFGISVGYAAKQFKNGDRTYPWCYIGDQAKSSSPAWAAGIYWAPEFRYGLGIQTGCYFDFASCKYADIKLFDCNLSIPARLQYRYVVLDDFSFFIFVGPSFELSLAYDISIGNGKENISLYDAGNLSRFNLLLGCGAGLRWKGLQIMFSSDWGLVNMLKNGSGYAKLNKPFSLTLSYNFKL